MGRCSRLWAVVIECEVVGGMWKSWWVCGSRGGCVEGVVGVWKAWVVCRSRGWCKQVVGGVNKSWVV